MVNLSFGMNILIIPDKFKGSLTANEVIHALRKAILQVLPSARIDSVLASDGGDGFLDSLNIYRSVQEVIEDALDPLGRPINAAYLWDDVEKTAYIELARTSGMLLLDSRERNPLHTSTRGTGMQLKSAIERGARRIYLGLGGSATNDGGCGIAQALGWKFRNEEGAEINPTGGFLGRISSITPGIIPKGIDIVAVNDVDNPLTGPDGAARVYAPQKGANPEAVRELDRGLRQLCTLLDAEEIAKTPGAGAAGGAAFGLQAFLGARFVSGIDFVLKLAGVSELLETRSFDLMITGEGKIDDQSIRGKLVSGVLDLGRRYGIPVIAVCGRCTVHPEVLGFKEIWEIRDPSKELEFNLQNAAFLLEKCTLRKLPEMLE